MIDQPTPSSQRRTILVIWITFALLLLAVGGCKTPDGPHFPIGDQAISAPAPSGLTRVVFLNTNYHSDNFASGPIRIQLDGQQIPSVWPERYVQTFLKPGVYDLLIEQASGFYLKQRDRIKIEGDTVLISVYKPTFATYPAFEILDELPSDFESAFRPSRHPKSW